MRSYCCGRNRMKDMGRIDESCYTELSVEEEESTVRSESLPQLVSEFSFDFNNEIYTIEYPVMDPKWLSNPTLSIDNNRFEWKVMVEEHFDGKEFYYAYLVYRGITSSSSPMNILTCVVEQRAIVRCRSGYEISKHEDSFVSVLRFSLPSIKFQMGPMYH